MIKNRKKQLSVLFVIVLSVSLIFTGCGQVIEEPGVPTATVLLEWDASEKNSDGSPLNDLKGYRVYYGTSPGSYDHTFEVLSGTYCSIGNLTDGTWYFAVKAFDLFGNESPFSEMVTIPVVVEGGP
jgi:hypothetical protein